MELCDYAEETGGAFQIVAKSCSGIYAAGVFKEKLPALAPMKFQEDLAKALYLIYKLPNINAGANETRSKQFGMHPR